MRQYSGHKKFPIGNKIISTNYGGESEIRTRDTVPRIHPFQGCALNRSAISPKKMADGAGFEPAIRVTPV